MHCVNAVFRMVSQHLISKDFTWEELDTLTRAIPGKATWTFLGEMEFAKLGITVLNIEPVDYERLFKVGIDYLQTVMGKDTFDYYINESNIVSVIKYIPSYLQYVKHETRRATTSEIVNYINSGYLVAAEVNSSILNRKKGFSLHFVLLYGFDGKHIILHDPGLPPVEARKISLKEFESCFNFSGANSGIIVFSK